MSIAEMRERKEKLNAVINSLSEDKLVVVEDFINSLHQEAGSDSIDFIYEKAVEQYNNTLQKLAQ